MIKYYCCPNCGEILEQTDIEEPGNAIYIYYVCNDCNSEYFRYYKYEYAIDEFGELVEMEYE